MPSSGESIGSLAFGRDEEEDPHVDRIIVTTLSTAAVLAAGFLAFRWRGSLRPATGDPTDNTSDSSRGRRFGEMVRTLSATVAAGALGGLLVAGFGSRLLMRVIAATSDDAAQGRRTEADAVVGEITLGGTFFLAIFGVGIGVMGSLGYWGLRRWLPPRSWAAGLVVAGIGAGLLARPIELLHPDSIDFEFLGPVWLAVVMIVLLMAGLGWVSGTLVDEFGHAWPAPTRSVRGIAGLLPLALLVVAPPLGLLAAAFAAVRAVGAPRNRDRPSVPSRWAPVALVFVGVVGWLWIAVTAVQVLAR